MPVSWEGSISQLDPAPSQGVAAFRLSPAALAQRSLPSPAALSLGETQLGLGVDSGEN